MKQYLFLLIFSILGSSGIYAQKTLLSIETNISLKSPGNPAVTYKLNQSSEGLLKAQRELPIQIKQEQISNGDVTEIKITLTVKERVYYNLEQIYSLPGVNHNDCEFYMPGFWYHRNLRSPKEAPSFHTSDSWQVREDRLSTPLTGIYNNKTGDYYTVLRIDDFKDESLAPHNSGEIILSDKTSLGFTGFRNINGNSALVFGFPYHEAPKTYIRKLTLNPSVQAFEKLEKGETRQLIWTIKKSLTV